MIQRNVVFQSKTDTGESVLNMPITVLKNIEDTAEIKDNISDDDYVPVIDSSDNSQMKKTNFKNAIASKADKSDVEAALDNKSDVNHIHDERYYTESEVDTKLSGKIDTTLKGSANGIAELNENGKVPSSQLPSYVDAVVEYTSISDFPSTGDTGKIYVDTTTNLTYRWSGSAYVEISPSIALGETSSTAYRGDRGKAAYDHISDTTAHITAAERTAWNSKAELTDIPTELPANGGNADTVDGLHANEIASNPNLLINPDFRINQRGLTEYTGTAQGYTVDRWWKGFQYLPTSGDVVVTTSESGSITITNSTDKFITFAQKVENSRVLYGKTVTASARIDGVTYMATGTVLTTGKGTILRSVPGLNFDFTVYQDCSIDRFDFELHIVSGATVTIDWAKVEIGGIATLFCPPDPATELVKCQRYFYRLGGKNRFFKLYGIAYGSHSFRFSHNLPVEMRITPTLTCSPGSWRFRIRKIPTNGAAYWNNNYGTTFTIDGSYSSPSKVDICVELDSSKTVNISEGDSVELSTNNELNSDGSQKYPGWLDFDAEL